MTQDERDQFNFKQRAIERERHGWGSRKDTPQYCKCCGVEIFFPNYYCEACRAIREAEVNRNKRHRRQARHLCLPRTLTIAEWNDTLAHFDNRCVYCGEYHESLQQDHFIPSSKGGGFTRANIVPACLVCNVSKSNSYPRDWLMELSNGMSKYNDITAYLYGEGEAQIRMAL